jgi:hypothetical protein
VQRPSTEDHCSFRWGVLPLGCACVGRCHACDT